ncbi:MAG: serine/threonine-protein kinase [Woeseiaceae bacterium]
MKKIIFSTESIVILIIINILAITTALKPDFLQSLETASYDFSVNKNRTLTDTHDRIAIITIDKKSSEKLGQWPWQRSVIANMLNKLTLAKAKTVGLQFSLVGERNNQNQEKLNQLKAYIENTKGLKRKQARKLKRLLLQVEQELDTDGQLAKSIFNAPNLILTMQPQSLYSNESSTLPNYLNKSRIKGKKSIPATQGIIELPDVLFPLKSFAKSARAVGHDNFTTDHDGTVRSQPLVLKYKGKYLPSFSLLLAARSQGIPVSSIRVTNSGVKLGKRNIKTNSQKQFYPPFLPQNSHQSSYSSYSFIDVLNGDIDLSKFRNKIVIIGFSDVTSNQFTTVTDQLPAPFISANIINGLIDQNYYSQPGWAKSFETIIFIAVLIYLFLVIPHFSSTITALISLFFITILIAINQYFLLIEHIWLQIISATFVLLFGHILFVAYHFLSSSKRQFLTESSDSIRMLVTTLQAQGQIDMAMEKLRSIPKTDAAVLGLAYEIAQDYESKRKFNKAISVYDYILGHNKKFKDTAERKKRAENVDNAVLLHSSSIITNVIDTMPKLGHYEIEKEIGRGAMGVVYLGHDSKIDRTVAIKTLALSEEFSGTNLKDVKKRFFNEAQVAGKLNHPNIVTVYDAGQEHDLTYMAMEYLDGHDLTHYIEGKKKPKVDWVLDIIWHMAGALDYAHDKGIIHRDVKPANIMYSKDGTVKIMDFGIARVIDSSTTKTGTALGTPSYMSPEQISGQKVQGSSDFFSLGVTMYELLTGELPFKGDSLPAMIFQITTKKHPSITSIRKRLPTCVKTIVDKLLQKDPKKRYPDGVSIQTAIERCMKK